MRCQSSSVDSPSGTFTLALHNKNDDGRAGPDVRRREDLHGGRRTIDGAIVSTFGTNGNATFAGITAGGLVGAGDAVGTRVVVQKSGRIVVGFTSSVGSAVVAGFAP